MSCSWLTCDDLLNALKLPARAPPLLQLQLAIAAGRTGTAYSLLTRDELPYALDLHLFLSRPLLPAPMQSLQQAAAAAETMDPQASMYGTFPQVRTQLELHIVFRQS